MADPPKEISIKLSSSLLQSKAEQSAAIVTSKGAVIVDLALFTLFAKEHGYKGIVLCVDRPHSFYVKILEANGISPKGIRFINVGFKETAENVSNIGEGPADLTFMKIEIIRDAQKMRLEEPKARLFLFDDAVTTLLIYNDEKRVGQFLHDLNNALRELDVYLVNIIEPNEKIGAIVRKLADAVVELN